jgi:hypothetical protein
LSDGLGFAPLTVKFTDYSVRANKRERDFDDGSKPLEKRNPLKEYRRTYSKAGKYNVTLAVTDDYNRSEESAMEINVSERRPDESSTWNSEETEGDRCGPGYLVKGMSCRNSYCDDKQLICAAYWRGKDRWEFTPWWSKWVSEETGRDKKNATRSDTSFVKGLKCDGGWCDNVSVLYYKSQRLKNIGGCYDKSAVSEEDGRREQSCRQGFFVAGLTCKGNYSSNIVLHCCGWQLQDTGYD